VRPARKALLGVHRTPFYLRAYKAPRTTINLSVFLYSPHPAWWGSLKPPQLVIRNLPFSKLVPSLSPGAAYLTRNRGMRAHLLSSLPPVALTWYPAGCRLPESLFSPPTPKGVGGAVPGGIFCRFPLTFTSNLSDRPT
jgi:hypothetical protein